MDEQSVCEFCGQVLLRRQACDCAGARKHSAEEAQIRTVCAELLDVLSTELVEQGEAPVQNLDKLLCEFIPMMVRGGVSSVVVTAEGIGKVTIRYNGADWKIKKQMGVSIERKV